MVGVLPSGPPNVDRTGRIAPALSTSQSDHIRGFAQVFLRNRSSNDSPATQAWTSAVRSRVATPFAARCDSAVKRQNSEAYCGVKLMTATSSTP